MNIHEHQAKQILTEFGAPIAKGTEITALNQAQAAVNADGSVTLVLSACNPGCSNWLSTAGHSQGTLCFRWVGAETPVDPTVTVVPTASLAVTQPVPGS